MRGEVMLELIVSRLVSDSPQPSYWTHSRTLIWSAFAAACVVNGLAVAVLAAGSATGSDVMEHGGQVWGSAQLLAICVIGSTLGTAAKIAFFPIPDMDTASSRHLVRMLATKATVSMVCGMAATPMIIRYFEWSLDVDILLGASAGVAFMADAILATAVAMWANWSKRKEEELNK